MNTRRQGVCECIQAEREKRVGQVAGSDWQARFLSHFIFKLNYFIAN
jgi:hypothetical protein